MPDSINNFEELKKAAAREQQSANAKPASNGHDTSDTWFNPVDLWDKFDPPELPTGLLPDEIEKYARVSGATMGADPAGFAMAALTVCAAAISDRIKLQPKKYDEHWLESARLWTMLIGDPSSKKSPILRQVVWPLAHIDADLVRTYQDAKARYDDMTPEERRATDPPTLPPKQPRIKIEDTTIEAAQEVLKDSPDGVLCLEDELSGWFSGMDKYSGSRGAGKDRAFWLQSFNGGPYSFHRIGRGSGLIPNLSVSMLGGIQPEPMRRLASGTMDDGLLQRGFPIMLQTATIGQDRPADPVVKQFGWLVKDLHKLQPPLKPGHDQGTFKDDVLRFSEGAQEIRIQLEIKHANLMKCEALHPKLIAHVGKYDGLFARLCVIWHCIDNMYEPSLPKTITDETARRVAAFLHDFLFRHAISFYVGVLGLADDHERLAAVAGYILARGLKEVTNRDIQRSARSLRKLTDQDTMKIFEQLEAFGWIERELPKRRGPKVIVWVVNSVVHSLFKERAEREASRRLSTREAILATLKAASGGTSDTTSSTRQSTGGDDDISF
jgi:Protein of unknown function (DUF3987)